MLKQAKDIFTIIYRNQGLELAKSPEYDENEAFSSYGIKSTAKDLLKISTLLPDSVFNQSGFPQDGWF